MYAERDSLAFSSAQAEENKGGDGLLPIAQKPTGLLDLDFRVLSGKNKNPDTRMGIWLDASISDNWFQSTPGGCVLKPEGLSHGLKTVHRTGFTLPLVGPAFRVPFEKTKIQIPEWVSGFLVRRKGLEPPTY